MNSAVIDFLITAFFDKNYYGRGGFIMTQTLVFVQNMYMNPLLSFFDYQYYLDRLSVTKTKLDLSKNECFMTQKELNEAIEEPEYCIAEKYYFLEPYSRLKDTLIFWISCGLLSYTLP